MPRSPGAVPGRACSAPARAEAANQKGPKHREYTYDVHAFGASLVGRSEESEEGSAPFVSVSVVPRRAAVRRLIDISVALDNELLADPAPMRPKISYRTHGQTIAELAQFFPGLSAADLPDGAGWAVEHISLSTYNGTHVDAPWHYHPTMDGGSPAMTIDEVPLPWCFAPAVKLDFRAKPDGHVVSAAEIEAELSRIGYELQPLDIVVVNTRAGAAFGQPDYVNSGCGMELEATMFLTERGIRMVGTDAWSWDAPFAHTAARYRASGDPSIIWEGHKAGRHIGYCQIEKLHNLEALPPHGFEICCFPVKVRAGSAGWTRAVAILAD